MARWRLLGAMAIGVVAGCGLVAGGGLVAGCAQPTAGPGKPVTEVAAYMLLGPDEFGEPGWRTDLEVPADPSSEWAFAMPHCPAYDEADYPAQRHREGVRTRAFVHPLHSAREWVERFAPGWSARSVEDARRVVDACNRYEHGDRSPGAPGFLESHSIEDSGFAADESVLVKTNRLNPAGASYQRYTAVVRCGDLVVTLTVTAMDADRVRELVRWAVSRLG